MNLKIIETGDFRRKKLAYPIWSNLEQSLNCIKDQSIRNIGINSNHGWGAETNLEFLNKHNWIEGVEIHVDGFDVSPINNLKRLKYLNFAGNGYKGVIDLKEMNDIDELVIGYNLKNLQSLDKAVSLHKLEFYSWPEENLQRLSKLECLEWLEIYRSPKLKSLGGIENLKNLFRLKFYSLPSLTDITALTHIANSLKKLFFELTKKVEGFEVLDELQNLESFYIFESAPIHSIQFLKKLKNLKYAYIGTEVLDRDVAYLEEKGIEYKKLKKYKEAKKEV